MKSISAARRVRSDLRKAADWYEEKEKGLGLKFLIDFNRSLTRIAEQPTLFQVIAEQKGRRIRRINFSQFSYSVLFHEDGAESVFILRVHHQRQDTRRI